MSDPLKFNPRPPKRRSALRAFARVLSVDVFGPVLLVCVVVALAGAMIGLFTGAYSVVDSLFELIARRLDQM